MAKVEITNGDGLTAKVSEDKHLHVITASYPSLETQKIRPFRQYFTVDGTSTGSSDMGVDGSSTNVEFYIPASTLDDRYITNVNIIVGYGTAAQPHQWADGTALTNGTRFYYTSSRGEVDIHEIGRAHV